MPLSCGYYFFRQLVVCTDASLEYWDGFFLLLSRLIIAAARHLPSSATAVSSAACRVIAVSRVSSPLANSSLCVGSGGALHCFCFLLFLLQFGQLGRETSCRSLSPFRPSRVRFPFATGVVQARLFIIAANGDVSAFHARGATVAAVGRKSPCFWCCACQWPHLLNPLHC